MIHRRLLLMLAASAPLTALGEDSPVAQEPRAQYEAALDAYKQQVREIEALWSQYQTADETQRDAIQAEHRALVAATQPKLDAMVDAALETYRAEPGADPQIAQLLASVAEFRVVGKGPSGGGDQYEEALPLLEALLEGGDETPGLPMWGVLAAVTTNRFDLADKFAAAAIERGDVSPPQGKGKAAEDVFGLAMRYLQEKERFRQRWEEEQKAREADAATGDLPRVQVKTSKGDVVIELFEDQAPTAVANFLSLVKKGFYDGTVFHRVLPRFMAQGGDPQGTGRGGPGYTIKCECKRPDARKHFRGTLSMAHAGRDTGGSQFFLCFVPTDHLDGEHTAFGRVVEGLEVLGELQAVDPQGGGGDRDKIVSATVLRDRGHAYDYEQGPNR